MSPGVEHAVEFELDAATGVAISTLFDALEAAGITSVRAAAPAAHAHVTLAIVRTAPPEQVAEVLADLGGDLPSLTMSHVGVFLAPAVVLFLGVTPTSALLERNAAIHRRLDDAGIETRPLSRPGRYVAHCTLAMHPASVAAAVAAVHGPAVAVLPLSSSPVAIRVVDVPTGQVRATVGR